jgi:hypothetical protein
MFKSFVFISMAALMYCSDNKETKQEYHATNAASVQEDTIINIALKLIQTKKDDGDNVLWDARKSDEFRYCHVTRIKYKGYYRYLFWRVDEKKPTLVLTDSIPIVTFNSDSLFDVNGDGSKDLVINASMMNGQCQADYCVLFCFDKKKEGFIRINVVSNIPNPKFIPDQKLVTGEMNCRMTRDLYKLKWKDRFLLDTIYIKSSPVKE